MMRSVVLPLVLVLAGALGGCGAQQPDQQSGQQTDPPAVSETPSTAPTPIDVDLGQAQSVDWTPANDVAGKLTISVEKVRKGDFSDFAGLGASQITEANQPFYVDAVIVNDGEEDLGGLEVPLYLLDSEGTLSPPWGFAEPFEPCRSGPLPTPFAAGDEVEACLVFFGSPDASFESITFQPTADSPVVSWTGDLTINKKSTGKKATGKKKRR